MDRLQRLRLFLADRDVQAAVLTKPANIAAFFCGAEISLGFRQEPPGRAAIAVREDGVTVLGNNTEVMRLAETELSSVAALSVRGFRWDEWDLRASVKAYLDSEGLTRVCDDIGAFGEDIGGSLEDMYYPLTEQETVAIEELANDTASLVEGVAKDVDAGATELQVAGDLTGGLVSRRIWPELVMVAGDDRISRYRHYLPKEIPIRRLCLLSVTVHRCGVYVSMTRLVSLGVEMPEWRSFQEACNRIDAKAVSLSQPGRSVGEIFTAIIQAYADEGHADEWVQHHQGGPAGFYGRDYKATQHASRCLVERQPVVWNPTVRGAKSEDTILTCESGQMPKVLTETGTWEYYDVPLSGVTVRRPAILQK